MNGEKMVNNQYLQGPSLRMVGITSSQINTRHAFLIYLTFKIKTALRNLDTNEETKTIPAICEVVEGVEETSNDVNLVEYECIGNSTEDENWEEYQLDDIKEGNSEENGNSLKNSNLNDFVKELKEENKFNEIEKTQPSFTYEDLIKIVIFQMKEKIESIQAKDYKFDFKIEGSLNKPITSEKIKLERQFDLAEISTKVKCVFNVEVDSKADLSCNFDVSNYKDIKTFSFKTSQINTEDNEIYLAKLNDIVLMNTEEKKDDNKTVIIVVSVVCAVVGAGLIALGTYCLVRKLKAVKNSTPQTNGNDNNKDVMDLKGEAIDNSGNRIKK